MGMSLDEAQRHLSGGRATYTESSGYSMVRDLAACEMNIDPSAKRRLDAHFMEHRSGDTTSTGAGGTLVAPDYVVPLFSRAIISAAPIFGVVPNHPLERTDAVWIPAVAGAPSASPAMGTQNSASVPDVSITDTFYSNPVSAWASANVASRQLVEQSPLGLDAWLLPMLADAVAAQASTDFWAGSGSGGKITGIANTSGVQSVSATSYDNFGEVVAAASDLVWTNRLRRPDTLVTSGQIFNWYATQHDTTLRPYVIAEPGPPNGATDTFAAEFLGMNWILDSTLPANTGFVLRSSDLAWFQRGPILDVFSELYGAQMSVYVQALVYGSLVVRFPSSVVVIENLSDTTPGS